MPVTLNPGFKGAIQIKDTAGTVLYQTQCTSATQVEGFISHFGKSKKGWSLLAGCVMPLRTNTIEKFTKDFFLPTLVNYALTVDHLALKILASAFAVTYDLVTLPIRLIATPFRLYYNYTHPEEDHPVKGLLSAAQLAKTPSEIILCYKTSTTDIHNRTEPDNNGDTVQPATKITIKGSLRLYLERIPNGCKGYSSEYEKNKKYIRLNNEDWIFQGMGTSSSSHYTQEF